MQQARQAANGPDVPVSSCLDNWRNQVDRYEVDGGPDCAPEVRIKVTLHPDCPRDVTAGMVEAWYWASVGTFRFDPVETNERPAEY